MTSFVLNHYPVILTFAVLLGVFALLALERFKPSLVAITGMAICLAGGALSTDNALRVFSSSAPLTIACMFVIAAALSESGIIATLGQKMRALSERHGVIGVICLLAIVFVISAFLNNTPTVIILAPVLMEMAKAMNLSPSRYLIPLSYVAVMGGTLSLIGTSTNILVDSIARDHGVEPFYVFEMTGPALCMAAAGMAFLVLAGPYFLPHKKNRAGGWPVCPPV